MISWIREYAGTAVILCILLGIVGGIVFYLLRQRKKGRGSCNSCSSCNSCGCCSLCGEQSALKDGKPSAGKERDDVSIRGERKENGQNEKTDANEVNARLRQ